MPSGDEFGVLLRKGRGGAHAHFFAFFGLPTELSVVVGARKGGPIGKE
jgi:hypothetical protein